jgi:hypothetical protein
MDRDGFGYRLRSTTLTAVIGYEKYWAATAAVAAKAVAQIVAPPSAW